VAVAESQEVPRRVVGRMRNGFTAQWCD